jgi:xylulokinase
VIPVFIGIDLGTSGVKLILVTKNGRVINTVTKEYELLIPKPSWTEQDPELWINHTIDALSEIVKGYEQEIEGIGFSGQMHGLVLLDNNDKVLRNALLWNDQRTIDEVDYLNNMIGIDKLLEYTGNIALTGLTAPKVMWVRNNEPDIFDKISKIMLPKDYLIYKLTGVFATDVSDTSGTLYFDVKNKKYSKEMLEIIGISENQLPKVYESSEVVGTLSKEICDLLGITHTVKVVPGGGDQAVGAIGVGIVEDGTCSISLGTSGVVFVASEEFKIDSKSYLQSYAHSNGKFHLMGVMLSAAGALKWWSESIFNNKDYETYFNKLMETPIEDSLFFLPYLTGERSPINDPNAKGVFFGLGLQHRKEHMDRAVIEGITFALKDSYRLIEDLGVDINTIRITGGGAKSPIWAQMIADIMNVETVTLKAEEGPALGAAILAMVGCEAYDNVEEACSAIIKLKEAYQPNHENAMLYINKYESFKKIYPKVKDLF